MKILYIHGLGSGKYSETPKRLREALPEAEVLSPEIPIDPIEAMRFLEENYLNDKSIDLVVGSSLGGFYSLLLPHHKKLLANPALFADEDIEKGIGLGEQEFLSPRENGAKTYVIDEAFIRGLAKIRDKIFNSDLSRPGMPDQEQIENTWAIFAKSDELLAHHDDFCHLFRPDHAFRMKGEHRVSEDNMRKDIVPLIRRIFGKEKGNGMDKRRKPKSVDDVFFRNPDVMSRLSIDSPEALVNALGDRYISAKREDLLEQLPDKDKRFLTDYYYKNCNAGMDRQPACLEVKIAYEHDSMYRYISDKDYIAGYTAVFDRIENSARYEGKTAQGTSIDIAVSLNKDMSHKLFSFAEGARQQYEDDFRQGKDTKSYYLDARPVPVRCFFADDFSFELDARQPGFFEELHGDILKKLTIMAEVMADN